MNSKKKKILLMALPFWSPLIPAQGIAHLKNYLNQDIFEISIFDLAAEERFLRYYSDYFNYLKEVVPINQRGNFYNVGHDILRGHLEAFNNIENIEDYYELIKQHICYNYYISVSLEFIKGLDEIVILFFKELKKHVTGLLLEKKPEVVGLSVNSGNVGPSVFMFKLAKEFDSNIKTVMGGSIFFNHFSVTSPDFEQFVLKTESFIDKFVIGKGEVILEKILNSDFPEDQKVFTKDDLTEEEINRSSNNLPDMSGFNFDNYLYLAASSSSSCPNNCSFCNVRFFFGPHVKKDIKQAAQEINSLNKKYGHLLYFMTDSLLNTVITDLSKELIRNEFKVYLDGYFRIDSASAKLENTLLWRQGGFYRARIGTESGSQKILDLMHKEITPELTRNALKGLAKAGIKTTTYWVVGHPQETEEDFQMTLDLIEELKDYIYQAECNPFTYYYLGQASTDEWFNKKYRLYPEEIRKMLFTQTWSLDVYPQREIIYKRVQQFSEHCKRLNIPNPYSIGEINDADLRWKKLQRNAVPSIIEVNQMKKIMSDKKNREELVHLTSDNQVDSGNFDFGDF